MRIEVPIRIESVANLREHFMQRAKRAREHRAAVWYALKATKAPHALPCMKCSRRFATLSIRIGTSILMPWPPCQDRP